MIAYVKGTLEEVTEGEAIVDVGGIGYHVKISAGTFNELPGLHREVKFHTYTLVREDAFQLYGFLEKEDLEIFKLLLSVNGVGPKGALAILSVMSAGDLCFAITGADSKTIAKAPGIGKRTAERIILDLRDKVSGTKALERETGLGEIREKEGDKKAKNEAVEALVALGYSAVEALKAVNQIEISPDTEVETILKQALKKMF